jgi:hypothetical protein
MMVKDFQQEGRLVQCLYAAGSVPEAGLSYRSELERKAQRTRPDGRLCSLVGGAEVGKKETESWTIACSIAASFRGSEGVSDEESGRGVACTG